MTNIQLNLTEKEFNLIWGVLNEFELKDEDDVKVNINLLNKLEDKIAEIDPNFFGVLSDDD
jgi:hypothetical protein